MNIRLIGQNVLIKSSSAFGNKWLETILFFDNFEILSPQKRGLAKAVPEVNFCGDISRN